MPFNRSDCHWGCSRDAVADYCVEGECVLARLPWLHVGVFLRGVGGRGGNLAKVIPDYLDL